MNLQGIRTELLQRGFSHIQTFGGLIPITEWNPYGASEGGVNYRASDRPWYGQIVEIDGQTYVEDVPSRPVARPFVNGLWPVIA